MGYREVGDIGKTIKAIANWNLFVTLPFVDQRNKEKVFRFSRCDVGSARKLAIKSVLLLLDQLYGSRDIRRSAGTFFLYGVPEYKPKHEIKFVDGKIVKPDCFLHYHILICVPDILKERTKRFVIDHWNNEGLKQFGVPIDAHVVETNNHINNSAYLLIKEEVGFTLEYRINFGGELVA